MVQSGKKKITMGEMEKRDKIKMAMKRIVEIEKSVKSIKKETTRFDLIDLE